MLNLFEMAYRFRADGIMAPPIFGSWVIWIWELCANPVFQDFWSDKEDGLPLNYIPDFRQAIDKGISISHANEKDRVGRKKFFRALAKDMGCRELEKWLRVDSHRHRKIPKRKYEVRRNSVRTNPIRAA
jgi:hypothetical protein